MKTKAKRTTTMRRFALTAALLLILALLLAFDAINGDPLSQQWAIYRAIRYAEKLYPEETFHWDQRTAADGQFFHYVVAGFCPFLTACSHSARSWLRFVAPPQMSDFLYIFLNT